MPITWKKEWKSMGAGRPRGWASPIWASPRAMNSVRTFRRRVASSGRLLARLLDTVPALPAAQRFAAHFDREFAALFAFSWAPAVDTTTWRAEHAIRTAVVKRRFCGGHRTSRGAQTQQILACVIRTERQRLVDLIELFTTLLRSPRPTVPKALHAPPG